jgi:plastocyanin
MEEQTQQAKKSSMTPVIIGIVVLLLLGGGGWLVLLKNNAQSSSTGQPSPSAMQQNTDGENMNMKESPTGASMEAKTVSPSEDAMGVKNITVEGKNFSFTPSQIKVKKGDTVKVTFKNISGFHNWTLAFNGKQITTKTIKSGESDTVEFVADKAGTYDYYCSVGNHRQMGMEGKLVVE